MTASLRDVVSYLDHLLQVADVPDSASAVNGLQVANSGSIDSIVAAVDACQFTIEAAARQPRSMLIVHHGLFWEGLQPVTGRLYHRLAPLIHHDVALYSAHAPLDCHEEFGNNILLGRALDLQSVEPFGDYRGSPIGVRGTCDLTRDQLSSILSEVVNSVPHVIPGGPDRIRTVGIVTGGAGSLIGQASDVGLDAFVTGEGTHHTHFDAMESGVNVFYAGHYATETFGVRALAEHLAARYRLDWQFVDYPTGL